MPSEKRKARKQNYFKAAKKSKKYAEGKVLKEGMVGFLLTCNNREKEAVREGYNLLNEFADKLFGSEKKPDECLDSLDTDDIDKAFDAEKDNLDDEINKKPSERRFQQVESGANNCLFIKTTLHNPKLLVNSILDDIVSTKSQKARYILRMIPVIGTCKAFNENIEKLAEEKLSDIFKEGTELTYCLLFKSRNNNNVLRDDMIKLIGSVVKNQPGKTSVDLKTPDICIVIEVIRNVCCLGIVEQYFKRKKYNLVELGKSDNLADTKSEENLNKPSFLQVENEVEVKPVSDAADG